MDMRLWKLSLSRGLSNRIDQARYYIACRRTILRSGREAVVDDGGKVFGAARGTRGAIAIHMLRQLHTAHPGAKFGHDTIV